MPLAIAIAAPGHGLQMPELPEVETVRRALAPYLEGARIDRVTLNRADLRAPFPAGFAKALVGQTIVRCDRRAKYLLFRLSGGKTWLTHLGMSGSFRFEGVTLDRRTRRYFEPVEGGKHDHVVMELTHPKKGKERMIFADARRFGVMNLVEDDDHSAELGDLGPEPLSNSFNAEVLAERLAGKATPIKAALLDQRVVAGLGNIYVSEALHRAHIRPQTLAGKLVMKSGKPTRRLDDLAAAIPTVLNEAIEFGGSTLRDFRSADGESGGYQARFAVYDREGEQCPTPGCTGRIRRIVQAGRSTYYCPTCQR
jgi:formamidopyrimidine-DNA glycosylase